MKRDRDGIYEYLNRLFYEYVNPPSEMASDIDGLLWKAANELAEPEEKKSVAPAAA